MPIDLNDVDSIENTNDIIANNSLDLEKLEILKDDINDQLINFNNLGTNLTSSVGVDYLLEIYKELLIYINDNIIGLVDLDAVLISPNKSIEIGNLTYEFLVIDLPFIILPSYLDINNIYDIDQFDKYFNNNLNKNISIFKTSIIKIIQTSVKELNRLKAIAPKIANNKNFQKLITKYTFYIELVNYGSSHNLFEYIRNIIIKTK